MNYSLPIEWATNVQGQLRGTWIHHLYKEVGKVKRSLLRQSEGEAILLKRYHEVHGKLLDMKNPKTFTEKLFWRMISWNRGVNPLFTQLTDKFSARHHVADAIGDEYLIKLLWYGNNARAIPFDRLPAQYVMKPSHTSQQVIIVRKPVNRGDLISRASRWLDSNYYWTAREYQYYGINPGVMIEECLHNPDGSLPLDYKFWCFNGAPELIQVINHARDMSSFFDNAWNQLSLSNKEGRSQQPITKPENLEEMIDIASRLSVGFGFVRVDLYNVNGRVYFGELTFTPTAGHMKLQPDGWDAMLGEKWDLSLEHRPPVGSGEASLVHA